MIPKKACVSFQSAVVCIALFAWGPSAKGRGLGKPQGILVVAAAAATAGQPSGESAGKIVVLPPTVSSLPGSTIDLLGELLTDAVRAHSGSRVMGRSDIDAMLGLENLKDQLGCDDTTCAAEIGGALGAAKLVAARIAKLGHSVIIVLKLIDTKGQSVLSSVKHKAADDAERYDVAVDEAVAMLFGAKARPQQGAAGNGSIRVETSSPGAIWLDGKDSGQTAPDILRAVPAGPHTVVVRSSTAQGRAEVEVRAGEVALANIDLAEALDGRGAIRITTIPPGLPIEVDGELVGDSPQVVQLPVGQHRVGTRPHGEWGVLEQMVAVAPETTRDIVLTPPLRGASRLLVAVGYRRDVIDCSIREPPQLPANYAYLGEPCRRKPLNQPVLSIGYERRLHETVTLRASGHLGIAHTPTDRPSGLNTTKGLSVGPLLTYRIVPDWAELRGGVAFEYAVTSSGLLGPGDEHWGVHNIHRLGALGTLGLRLGWLFIDVFGVLAHTTEPSGDAVEARYCPSTYTDIERCGEDGVGEHTVVEASSEASSFGASLGLAIPL